MSFPRAQGISGKKPPEKMGFTFRLPHYIQLGQRNLKTISGFDRRNQDFCGAGITTGLRRVRWFFYFGQTEQAGGEAMKRAIQSGDTVSVHYTGKLENGEIFDSSSGRRPMTFTVGTGQIIRGFDEAVLGMAVGDRKTVTIAPERAYGPRQTELIVDIPRNTVPEGMELEKGMMIELVDPQGNRIPAEVFEILDEVVKMDLNHFLAGKTLVFDIEIVAAGPSQDPG